MNRVPSNQLGTRGRSWRCLGAWAPAQAWGLMGALSASRLEVHTNALAWSGFDAESYAK